MTIIKLPIGTNPVINGTPFLDYAMSTPPPARTSVSALRMNVITVPGNPDEIVITTPPAIGRALMRHDGDINLDLTDVPASGQPLSIGYEATKDGVTSAHVLDVVPLSARQTAGHGEGLHYMLPLDNNDQILVEPGQRHRKLYCDVNGFSRAQIEAREGGVNATGTWLESNFSAVEGLFYGSTPEMALDEERGKVLWARLCANISTSNWLLLKRGQTFTEFAGGGVGGARGESPLHPLYIGGYGTGADPIVTTGLGHYDNCVVQNVESVIQQDIFSVEFMLIDGIRTDESLNSRGLDRFSRHVTFRRWTGFDVVKKKLQINPNDATRYSNKPNRHQGMFCAGTEHFLAEKRMLDVCGWSYNYSPEAYVGEPFPPFFYSHCDYFDKSARDVTIRDSIVSQGALTGTQARGGGVIYNNLYIGNNLGLLFGVGGKDNADVLIGNANYGLAYDNVLTWAGQRTQNLQNMEKANGIKVEGYETALINNVIMHTGEGNDGIRAHGVAIGGGRSAFQSADGEILFDDTLSYGWLDEPARNLGAVDPSVLDGTTLEDYAAEWLGLPAADRYDLLTALRAEVAPWQRGRDIIIYFQEATGKTPPAAQSGTTRIYQPNAQELTRGTRWDSRYDWVGGAVPGQVSGDSINLAGYAVTNFDNVTFPLIDIDLQGGRLTQFGGKLSIEGDIITGGELHCTAAGQIFVNGGSITGPTRVELTGGRFANTADLAGNFDLIARGPSELLLGLNASTCTIASNHRLKLSGVLPNVGFDGEASTKSRLTFEPGATLQFSAGLSVAFKARAPKNVDFVKGNVVTGELSGFVGTLVHIENDENKARGIAHFDTLNGISPVDGEALIGIGQLSGLKISAGPIASVDGTPSYGIGKIATFGSGIFGVALPDVTTEVVCDGALEIDVDGWDGAISETLINCSVRTGSFENVTATGLGARDMIVTLSDTEATLDISATGSGQITQLVT